MILVGFLLFLSLGAALLRYSVFNPFSNLISEVHFQCLSHISAQFLAIDEMKALVCGENFPDLSASKLYIATGLIHLFVVSGAHLLVLQKILTAASPARPLPKPLLLGLLLIYAMACGMNPPVTRSLCSLFFAAWLQQRHLFWPENFKTFLIGILTLCLQPLWLGSISLQLSWLAALALSFNRIYFKESDLLVKQLSFFLILLPLLLFLQVISPAVLIMNLVFTPILEFILFPLGLLGWALPVFHFVFDGLIFELKKFLDLFEFYIQPQLNQPSESVVYYGWGYILLLHFLFHFLELNHRRKNNV